MRYAPTPMSSRPTWAVRRRSVLSIENMDAFYGKVPALRGISIVVEDGEVVTLVGANGAGKSTLLKAISGTVNATGRIEFDGR
ncbi:MAG: ATP-binding cassette domain-containing protein, partial [Actinobacteria bacterium]|nr:ATP-binding cassette domain-containing protein [Actinomycetota bacterium]